MTTQLRPVDGIVEIPLTQGLTAIIDEDDVERIAKYKWGAKKDWSTAYAKRTITVDGKQQVQLMHRVIMNAPADKQVDHINGDGLDNRKSNLRLCSQTENRRNVGKTTRNTSGFKGVHYDKQFDKWKATITIDNKTTFICYSKCIYCAADAYNKKAKEAHGEFASVNPPVLCEHLLREHDDTAYTLLREGITKKRLIEAAFPGSTITLEWKQGHNRALDDILTLLDHIYGKTDALTK